MMAQTETPPQESKLKKGWKNVCYNVTHKADDPQNELFINKMYKQQLPIRKKDLKILRQRMSGMFSSEGQATGDTNFFNIRLVMKQMWTERKDGNWIYVEQASAKKLDKPYRQRVYHVYKQDKKTVISQVYEMNSPLRFAGEWQKLSPLQGLTPDSLISREGCAISLHRNKKGLYYGSTPGKECLSSLRGSTYATSEVVIFDDRILSWDRGFGADDKQVWGSEKGSYIFVKMRK